MGFRAGNNGHAGAEIWICLALLLALTYAQPVDADSTRRGGQRVGYGLDPESPHAALEWNGPDTCLTCHSEQAHQVHASVMYQWQGDTPEMVNGQPPQGKAAGGLNSYCVSILGNWEACGGCHVGLGAMPEEAPSEHQLRNVDCMICHQESYRRKRVDGVFVPDEQAMGTSMRFAARTVHMPSRANCLQCHARAGGGDAVKRGDLALAQADTADRRFDVHMATTGADLLCQDCHQFIDHRVAGRGSDLRPSDSDRVPDCAECHSRQAGGGHAGTDIDHHVVRVACQTCHIPRYAKNAAGTSSSEATETHRTWLDSHAAAPPYHPASVTGNDLLPRYRFWNRSSDNLLLGDAVSPDPATGRYPTSRPLGSVGDPHSKLYPFKYKTAEQPIANATSQLIAIDTAVYFATADPVEATRQGLTNMGLSPDEPFSWVETDTFQLLNHQVSPESEALRCNDCHGSTVRIDLVGELGYGLKGPASSVCRQCHGSEDEDDFFELHEEHVEEKRYDCSWCHAFSRPERGLRMP